LAYSALLEGYEMGDFANAAAGLETDIRTLLDRMEGAETRLEATRNLVVVLERRLAEAKDRLTALETPPPPAPEPGWELVWSDEFDWPLVTPDPLKWTRGENSWGGNTLGSEHQAWHPDQSYVRAGNLRLEANRVTVPVGGKSYVSGIVHTKGKAEWLPPLRVEVRARYPVGNGFWPGIWLLHDTHRKADTYEIDILEVMGNKPDETYHTDHWYPADYDHKEIDCWQRQAPGFAQEWHTYALEWWPDALTWDIDGRTVQTIRADTDELIVTVPPAGPRTTTIGRPIISDKPMHLILDLSLGGWGGNAPDATTPLPASLEVDFVRVSRWRE
jgi:beta-glucanase (GH16 family)